MTPASVRRAQPFQIAQARCRRQRLSGNRLRPIDRFTVHFQVVGGLPVTEFHRIARWNRRHGIVIRQSYRGDRRKEGGLQDSVTRLCVRLQAAYSK